MADPNPFGTPPASAETPKPEVPATPVAPTTPSPVSRPRVAKAVEPEPAKPIDETVPGGRYMVNGVLVNAQGRPVGTPLKPDGE